MVENTNSLAQFDSTWLVIVIIVQKKGIRLEVEANNSGSFFIGSYTNIFKSKERSSYSPNLAKDTCPNLMDTY